jgi:putative FmdB family regulatory protein
MPEVSLMPTYEYRCEKCGASHEFFHTPKERKRKCPTCKTDYLRRLVSGGCGIIFKGPGFYATDYKGKN